MSKVANKPVDQHIARAAVSKPKTSSGPAPAGITVKFAMPPMLRATDPLRASRRSKKSNIGTSGAPWPPAAMSAGTKIRHHRHAHAFGDQRRFRNLQSARLGVRP